MKNSAKFSMFYNNKKQFFLNNQFNRVDDSHFTKCQIEAYREADTEADADSYKANYLFLSRNKFLVEQEFNDLFNVLMTKRDLDPVFWLYCYYSASLLEKYYQGYGQKKKVKDYIELQEKIKKYFKNEEQINAKETNSCISSLADVISDFPSLPMAKIRDKTGLANLCRIYWVFCHAMLEEGLIYSRKINLLDKLDDLLGSKTDVDGIVNSMNTPGNVLYGLSVGFFALRCIINVGMVIKHVCFRSEFEENISRMEIFKNEMNKRGVDILNHAGWSIINLITNYNTLFKISIAATGWIVVGFLLFDVATILFKKHQQKQAFLLKREQYDHEITRLIQKIAAATGDDGLLLKRRLEVLREQNKQLEIDWHTKRATYDLMLYATVALMIGYSASMLFTPALAIIASYFVCILAVATYLSEDAYANYKKSKLQLGYADKNPKNAAEIEVFMNNYIAARNEYIKTMVKYSIMPSLLITTYVICWPAAVALTLLFLGYEAYTRINKHSNIAEGVTQLAPWERSTHRWAALDDNSDSDDLDDARPLLQRL